MFPRGGAKSRYDNQRNNERAEKDEPHWEKMSRKFSVYLFPFVLFLSYPKNKKLKWTPWWPKIDPPLIAAVQ